MHTLFFRLSLALAASGAIACAAANGPMPDDSSAGSTGPGPLVSSLQVETSADSIRFVLQVTNTGPTPVTLDFTSGQSFDFVVQQGGREVWRWSADRMFTQALRTETLRPGDTRSFDAAWVPPAGTRGEFVARGFLTARQYRAEQRAQFRFP
ncbi:MAG TPA: BsuPI-related putative proteinase inhibitor [Longimicrobiaceae bacterium]|nr:BsuPI-related putative proteinase inhibitor [Longimicrobiaceae bacterium]